MTLKRTACNDGSAASNQGSGTVQASTVLQRQPQFCREWSLVRTPMERPTTYHRQFGVYSVPVHRRGPGLRIQHARRVQVIHHSPSPFGWPRECASLPGFSPTIPTRRDA